MLTSQKSWPHAVAWPPSQPATLHPAQSSGWFQDVVRRCHGPTIAAMTMSYTILGPIKFLSRKRAMRFHRKTARLHFPLEAAFILQYDEKPEMEAKQQNLQACAKLRSIQYTKAMFTSKSKIRTQTNKQTKSSGPVLAASNTCTGR